MQKFLGEFVGTFVFVSVILAATGKDATWSNLAPLFIIFGLLAGVVVAAPLSGAHLNPAVSVVMYLNKSLSLPDLMPYIAFQVLGGVAAKMCYDMLRKQ